MSEKENMPRGQPSALDDILEQRIARARGKRDWRKFIVQTLCMMLAVFLLLELVISIGVVHGDSMEPNVHDGDVCLCWRLSKKYRYGDVVFFKSKGAGEILVKRVIAGPGDTIEINGYGQVIVNDVILHEAFIYSETYAYVGGLEYPLTLGENEYFCMGDNRQNSLDSRLRQVGIVNKHDIIGKILLITGVRTENM